MQAQSASVLDAYIASQANPGNLSGLGSWTSLQDAQVHLVARSGCCAAPIVAAMQSIFRRVIQAALPQGQARQGTSQPPSRFGSAEALAFSSNAAANFGQDFRALIRPHPQHHQIADARYVITVFCSVSHKSNLTPSFWPAELQTNLQHMPMLMQRPLLLLLHGKGMQEQLQQTPGL